MLMAMRRVRYRFLKHVLRPSVHGLIIEPNAPLLLQARATIHSQLRERLVTLCEAFKIIEPLQISAVGEIERAYTDHWIQVQVDLPPGNDREQRNYWALLRETLSLISVMAVDDYDGCVELLTTVAEMVVPAPLDLSKQRLHTRFILDFGDRHRELQRNRDWYERRNDDGIDSSLLWMHFEVLFQPETAVRVTKAMTEALRESTAALVPIETQIRINFELDDKVGILFEPSEMLDRLTDAFMKAEEASRTPSERAVQLKLESIYLNAEKLRRHTKIMKGIRTVLKIGVVVETLHLPSSLSIDREGVAEQAIVRANLLCTILNNPANRHSSNHRQVNVRRFATTIESASSPVDYEAFYSALAGSRTLKTLYLGRLESRVDDLPMMWLAYALFSKHSQVQVEMLQLSGLNFDDQSMERWTTVIEAENPL